MEEISENSLVGEIIAGYPETIGVLLACGMHCLGCPASRSETLAEACAVHGLDVSKVLFAVKARIAHERRRRTEASPGISQGKEAQT